MTIVQQMASFIQKAVISDLSDEVRNQIKIRILDSLGVAIGAVECAPIRMIRVHIQDFGHCNRCTMLGGGTTSPGFAALYNSALVRYLDYNDSYNALAISDTPLNALRVTRTGALSHWKGLAYPFTAFGATSATFLAMRGITGPMEVFEGNKGFQESIAGKFNINWEEEDLERVNRTILKKFNAEIHSQATLEGAIELIKGHEFDPREIEKVEILTFDVAFHIIGGGEKRDKTIVRTKEEADNSLHYMTAVALLDGQVLPEQYLTERIQSEDVQLLLRKIEVMPSEQYSARFPDKMRCPLAIYLKDNRTLEIEKVDYEDFHTRPMSWETVCEKFEKLAAHHTDQDLRRNIIDKVQQLENHTVKDLTKLIAQVRIPEPR